VPPLVVDDVDDEVDVAPDVDDVEEDDEEVAAAVMSSQRPSATCTQTAASDCERSSFDAWSHVSNTPIEQSDEPHTQTRSGTPLRRRKPQCGVADTSTTNVGHIVVAVQSCVPVVDSAPHPPPTKPLDEEVVPASVVVLDELLLLSLPVSSDGTHA
jgi:hypothetical protein